MQKLRLRRRLASPVFVGALLAISSQAAAAAPAGALPGYGFDVPSSALVRPLGEIPAAPCPATASQACQGATPGAFDTFLGNYPMQIPGLGIPLGGVGAGSFMVNQSGTFGPWDFGGEAGASWEMRALPQAAFHIREQVGNSAPTVTTLATAGPQDVGTDGPVPQRSWQSPLSGWNLLAPGQGTYAALYPFGWMKYSGFADDISMRFFSPIVAGESRETSLPLAYFDVRVANPTTKMTRVSVMFTMPNAPAHVAGTNVDPSLTTGPASIRTGFTSAHDESYGVDGVTLGADSPENTPDSADSNWTVAALQQPGQVLSYVTSWNANGNGSDIYSDFSKTGVLSDGSLDNSDSAAAVSASVQLAPGEVRTIHFVLAWDFPEVAFDSNQTVWMRRYTQYYGARTNSTNNYVAGSYPGVQSFNIARDGLLSGNAALHAVENWWLPIAKNPTYPSPLKTAALNGISQLVFNNSFWENGLVSNSVVPTGFASAAPQNHLDASIPGSHLFGIQDAGGGGSANDGTTNDIQVYNYRGYYSLFPNLFGSDLEASAQTTALSPNGNAQEIYDSTAGSDPFILWGNPQSSAIQGGTDSRPPDPGVNEWNDSPAKYMAEWYAYSKMTSDGVFLRSVWPAMKSEIGYLEGSVPAGSNLPEDPSSFSNIYDIVQQSPEGEYNSELYLLALSIGVAAGQQVGAPAAYINGLRTTLTAARTQFNTDFWNPSTDSYRLATSGSFGNDLFADAFFAQHLAVDLGLPDLVNPVQQDEQLQSFSTLMRSDASGDPIGAAMVSDSSGSTLPEATWIWPGPDYLSAADLYQTGTRFHDYPLQQEALQLGDALATQVWLNPSDALAFDQPAGWSVSSSDTIWYPGYSMQMAPWDLLNAISPLRQY